MFYFLEVIETLLWIFILLLGQMGIFPFTTIDTMKAELHSASAAALSILLVTLTDIK